MRIRNRAEQIVTRYTWPKNTGLSYQLPRPYVFTYMCTNIIKQRLWKFHQSRRLSLNFQIKILLRPKNRVWQKQAALIPVSVALMHCRIIFFKLTIFRKGHTNICTVYKLYLNLEPCRLTLNSLDSGRYWNCRNMEHFGPSPRYTIKTEIRMMIPWKEISVVRTSNVALPETGLWSFTQVVLAADSNAYKACKSIRINQVTNSGTRTIFSTGMVIFNS